MRLGLLRPDDYDDEVLGRIPPAATRIARLAPAAVTVASAAAVAARWPSLPARVPTHFGLGGRADGFGPRAVAWLPTAASAVVSGWAALPTAEAEDRPVRPAIAASAATLCAGITAATLCSAAGREGDRAGLLVPASIPLAVAGSLAALVGPVRAGLRASWGAAR